MRLSRFAKRSLFLALVLGTGLAAATAASAKKEAKASAKTMENLQAAFNGESNAHARYLAFAAKADSEGYAGAAGLFRAAARAEEVHAGNHAEVIRKFGGEPKAEIVKPEVKSTVENLQAAVEGETYERDTMYPEFIERAKAEKNKDALRTFNFAKTAEAEHAKLYAQAAGDLGSWTAKTDFYVCSVCGFTTTNLDFEKCVSCFNSKEKYETVS